MSERNIYFRLTNFARDLIKMLKSDFHIHTSMDTEDDFISYSPKNLVRYAAKKGFEVLSITHHNDVYFNRDIASFAKRKGILLIPGVEAKVEGKHTVLINYDGKRVNSFRQLERARNEGALVVAPHPYFIQRTCLGRKLVQNIDLFDAIEYSHFYLPYLNLNKKAVKVARKYGKTLLGNSDAHYLYQFGTTYSLVDADKNVNSVLEAIRKGNVNLKSKPLNFRDFLKVLMFSIFK